MSCVDIPFVRNLAVFLDFYLDTLLGNLDLTSGSKISVRVISPADSVIHKPGVAAELVKPY